MENSENQKPRSSEEIKFREFLKTGDDFNKIEIYRLAKYWYAKALETGFEAELLTKKIREADQKIKSEQKAFTILGVLAIFIIIAACAVVRM